MEVVYDSESKNYTNTIQVLQSANLTEFNKILRLCKLACIIVNILRIWTPAMFQWQDRMSEVVDG